MARCAGLFVVEKDRRGVWHPEIRLSIPLLRRRDWPWPQQVCGMNCRTPEDIVQRILEHELIHYKLWVDGKDFGHTALTLGRIPPGLLAKNRPPIHGHAVGQGWHPSARQI
jgi:hypothetical protein